MCVRARTGEWRKAQLKSHARLTQMFHMSPLTHEAPVCVNDRNAHLQQQGCAHDVPYKQGAAEHLPTCTMALHFSPRSLPRRLRWWSVSLLLPGAGRLRRCVFADPHGVDLEEVVRVEELRLLLQAAPLFLLVAEGPREFLFLFLQVVALLLELIHLYVNLGLVGLQKRRQELYASLCVKLICKGCRRQLGSGCPVGTRGGFALWGSGRDVVLDVHVRRRALRCVLLFFFVFRWSDNLGCPEHS